MEALLAALVKYLPEMVQIHGALFFAFVLSAAANVFQWRHALRREVDHAAETRRLNELVNTEIRNGTNLGERLADKFTTAAEAYRDAIAAKRAR
jgi:ABC-type transport system involved in Fe-S cluster assembly fused permease/ATPase subunit